MDELFTFIIILSTLFLGITLYIIFGIVSGNSNTNKSKKSNSSKRKSFPDRFASFEELQKGLKESGLESSNLIIGIDYTKSNLTQGETTFGGKSLHDCTIKAAGRTILNPYQQVISIIGKTLKPFDDDGIIPVYGFGDVNTTNKSTFPFYTYRHCQGLDEVLKRYTELTPTISLCGPSNFAPIIRKAIEIVKEEYKYHILIIITDGEVITEKESKKAIVEASNYPLSIICVGVGDGPFNLLYEFDDDITDRQFDNFQFVHFHDIMQNTDIVPEVEFARMALMEIPDQYMAIRELGLLERK